MYIFLKCFENNFNLEILINELGRLFQYFTLIFVKRNRFLEVLDAFLIHLLIHCNYNNFYSKKSGLQINL